MFMHGYKKHMSDLFLNGITIYFEPLTACRLNGMVDCGERHKRIYQRAMLLVEQVKVSKGSPLVTCLLEGPSGR